MINNNDKKYVIDNENLMKEWNWSRNNELGLNPEELTCDSHKKAWWVCDNGHEWEAAVKDHNNGIGCPYCSGKKVLSGYNDLATTNPEIAKQWSYDKNGDLTPQNITTSSHKKVWWVCNNGHEFESAIYNYVNGYGCKMCAKK